MIFSSSQLIYIGINIALILLAAGLTFLIIKLLKIKDKSTILLFIVYIIYWIAPLVTRDYTSLIQIHMDIKNNIFLFVPIVCYGIIGIFYRPLSDFMALRMKSRKNVIYISLVLQFALALPFFIYPCLATNIVQSIGAGVGASCIGLFNLMFNERESQRKIGFALSILALPPLIAQFFASGFICIVVSIVHSSHTGNEYVDIVKYLWLVALIMCVAATIITIFIKEKGETLYQIRPEERRVIKTKKDWGIFVGLCICAALISITKWCVGGATASVQIAYVANKTGVDTRAYEGYASLVGSVGQIIGLMACNLWLTYDNKTRHKRLYLIIIATILGLLYFILNGFYVNIGMFMLSSLLNGCSYGIFANILLAIILVNVFEVRKQVITPVGVYNTALAIGIVSGCLINSLIKQGIFDQMHGFSTYSFEDFKVANWKVNIIGSACLVAALIIYIVTKIANKSNRRQKVVIDKQFAVTSDTEM